jgi:hypothetical protein
MNSIRMYHILIWLIAGISFGLLAIKDQSIHAHLGNPSELTGYCLLVTIVFLAFFNIRKRLSMLPMIGKASTWFMLHTVGGFFVLAVYWLHTKTIWPTGMYEKSLAILFYLTVTSGIIGYLIQQIYPKLLTQTGVEVIFERIPLRISKLRQKAEETMLKCCNKSGVETLGKHYLDTLQWFFAEPRFTFQHLIGSQRSQQWIQHQDNAVRRYLNIDEQKYLNELSQLAYQKNIIDIHYTLQGAMKCWLLIHIPLTSALMLLSFWHFLVVNVYAL